MGSEPAVCNRNVRAEEQDLSGVHTARFPPDRGEGPWSLFSPGEAACPPDAASPDLEPDAGHDCGPGFRAGATVMSCARNARRARRTAPGPS